MNTVSAACAHVSAPRVRVSAGCARVLALRVRRQAFGNRGSTRYATSRATSQAALTSSAAAVTSTRELSVSAMASVHPPRLGSGASAASLPLISPGFTPPPTSVTVSMPCSARTASPMTRPSSRGSSFFRCHEQTSASAISLAESWRGEKLPYCLRSSAGFIKVHGSTGGVGDSEDEGAGTAPLDWGPVSAIPGSSLAQPAAKSTTAARADRSEIDRVIVSSAWGVRRNGQLV